MFLRVKDYADYISSDYNKTHTDTFKNDLEQLKSFFTYEHNGFTTSKENSSDLAHDRNEGYLKSWIYYGAPGAPEGCIPTIKGLKEIQKYLRNPQQYEEDHKQEISQYREAEKRRLEEFKKQAEEKARPHKEAKAKAAQGWEPETEVFKYQAAPTDEKLGKLLIKLGELGYRLHTEEDTPGLIHYQKDGTGVYIKLIQTA